MLKAVELRNARVFYGRNWRFEIAPVTAFCGVNSSGKSTVLKSVMLLKQSQETLARSRDHADGRLNFSGPYVDLGSFGAFVSKGDMTRDVTICLEFDASDLRERADALAGERDGGPAHGGEPGAVVCRCSFKFGLVGDSSSEDEQNAPQDSDANRKCRLKATHFALMRGDQPVLDWSVVLRKTRRKADARRSRTDYRVRIPRWYFEQVGGDKFVQTRAGATGYFSIPVILDGLLPSSMSAMLRAEWLREKELDRDASVVSTAQVVPLPPIMSMLVDRVADFLDNVHYIGPLRAPAKRFYFSDMDAAVALREGDEDYVMHALRTGRDCEVLDLPPGRGTLVERNLRDALQSWLYYFQTGRLNRPTNRADEIDLRRTGEVILQPIVTSPYSANSSHSLADSGFGYSQSLPILIALLTAEPDSTTLIEQPELHLHPSLQVRLAEFLVSMARAGRRIVVETHSEHIVNALRAAVAESTGARLSLKEQCRVYYLEPGPRLPSVTDLSVKPDGTMSDWPRSFFGESANLARRLVLAQVRAVEKSRKQGDQR